MKNRFSFIALVVSLAFILCISFFFYPKWEKGGTEATLSWDVSGYYFYLPAFFIYDDYKNLDWKDNILSKYNPTPNLQQAFKHSSGNMVMKYPIGQSILMSPFFALGHTIALSNNSYEADGFSMPYQYSIGIGMLLYLILGLVLFRKVMLLFFKDKIAALLILGVALGSNYLNFSAIEQAQSHNTLFFLYCALILLSHNYYKKPNIYRALTLGITVGFMTLVRPTELLSLLIPMLYGVHRLNEIPKRLTHFYKYWSHLLWAALGLILMVSIQLIYWKMASGDWVVYSYEDQGFSWLHPHIKDYCFSSISGWLRFCPFLILAFVGLPFIYRHQKSAPLIILFTLLFTYVVTSWDVWSFGGRAMIQSYPILFISIGALFTYVAKKGTIIKLLMITFCLLTTYLNIWWTYQAHAGQIAATDVSDAYWLKTVGRFNSPIEDLLLIDNPHQQAANATFIDSIFNESINEKLNNSNEYLNFIELSKDAVSEKKRTCKHNKKIKAAHIRLRALIEIVDKEWGTWQMPTLSITLIKSNEEVISSNIVRINRIMDNGEKRWINIDVPAEPKADSIIFSANNSYSNRPIRVYAMQAYYINE